MTESARKLRQGRVRLPFATVRGVVAASLLVLNTLFWCGLLFLFALVKLVVPARSLRAGVDRVLNGIATSWVAGNSAWMRFTQRTQWDVAGLDDLAYRGWYMVTCNHQSWVDVLALQHLLNRRVPMLKFFLKQQLIYVPVIGLAWWALDFPFMRRHSDTHLKRHPESRFDDIEATRQACEKFARLPTSVMNFVEGTRFTSAKHCSQHSPYRHLLKPKAGALALALGVLGERFDSLLDVTIVYPDGAPTFWQFLCGDLRHIVVRAQRIAIPPAFRGGDYARDPKYRKTFQRWLQALWHEKDARIDALVELPGVRRPPRQT
ncbi:MAG: acyltransferase [Betaproteobacteria bacterium]|nr:acyltransferase [Betaproteobacteria bacterium]